MGKFSAKRFGILAVAALCIAASASFAPAARAEDAPPLTLFAAGSLAQPFAELTQAFTTATGIAVKPVFGPSGILRQRIEAGEVANVFASADMDSPLALSKAGKSGSVVLFARNRLCAVVRPGLDVTSATLLATILDPKIKLGTSTPVSDPSGDYTWTMFDRADAVKAGNAAALKAKAIKLMGSADSPKPPPGTSPVVWHLREGRADIFISYCTATKDTLTQLPGAKVLAMPDNLAIAADYGLTVPVQGASDAAYKLALFILSAPGQQILARYGFDAPDLPAR